MSSSNTSLYLTATKGPTGPSEDIWFVNPEIRGLVVDAVPVELHGVTTDPNANMPRTRTVTAFKSSDEGKVIEFEVDLLTNLHQVKRFIGWLDEVVHGTPCATSSKRRGYVSIARPGSSPRTVTIENAIPVGWQTSAFDAANPPRVTLRMVFDEIEFKGESSVTSPRPPEVSSLDTGRSRQWVQTLQWDSPESYRATVDSCSGFGQAIETERVWSTAAGRLIHTVVPGSSSSSVRFVVKPEDPPAGVGTNAAALTNLTNWFNSIKSSKGIPERRQFKYFFALGSGVGSEFSITLEEACMSSLELRGINPGGDLSEAFDLIATRLSIPNGLVARRSTEQMAPSLRIETRHSKITENDNSGLRTLVLRPTYIVPSVSRKMQRNDVKLGLSGYAHNIFHYKLTTSLESRRWSPGPLVQPEYGDRHYDPSEPKNPQIIQEVSFFVYASNPWGGHQIAKHDLRVHLENALFPLFYAFYSSNSERKSFDWVEGYRHEIDLYLEKMKIETHKNGFGWRENRREDTQLPSTLFSESVTSVVSSHPSDQQAFNLPIVISFAPDKRSAWQDNSFARVPITGSLYSCSYSIDQWHPNGEPWRAVVTLGIQSIRGLDLSRQGVQSDDKTRQPEGAF